VSNTDFYFTLIQKDGTRKITKLPIADSKRKTAYWLPRASFVELLYQEIHQHWQDAIQVLFNTECVEIKQHLEHLEIITQSQEQEQLTFIPL